MLQEKLRAQILNGSLSDCKNHLSGTYKGYPITVHFTSPFYFVNITATAPSESDATELQSFLTSLQVTTKGFGKFVITAHSIQLSISTTTLLKSLPERINQITEPVINYLLNAGFSAGCGKCGDTISTLSKYEINGSYHYLCETCAKQVESSLISNQQETKMQRGNFMSGIIGALLGSLLGAILWIVIYKLGYIAGIAGAATVFCAFKGYELFGKHLDKRGVIVSLLITILMLFFANRIAWTWEAYDVLKELDISFFDIYKNLDDLLSVSGLTSDYYFDLLVGYGLTIACSIRTIMQTWNLSSGKYSMKKF